MPESRRVYSAEHKVATVKLVTEEGRSVAIQQYFAMLPSMPGGKELSLKLRTALTIDPGQFEARWAAD